jgi:hypothetical protein
MATYKSIRYIVPVEAVEHTDSINALSDVDTDTTAPTDGQILKWNNTNSKWYPGDVEESASGTQKALFGFGRSDSGGRTNITNLVSSSGVVATDTTGVGTARDKLTASGYGGDKAIFGFGFIGNTRTSITNLVSNLGVVASDTAGVGTARLGLAASGFGGDKAIFGFGSGTSTGSGYNNVTNLVSNVGVVASDTTGVGTARSDLAAAGYGGDKALFGYGAKSGNVKVSITNLVSNTGVVASDTTGVGSARFRLAAAGYGGDKAIFGYGDTGGISNGNYYSMTNLVSNTGVVASDTTGVGTTREQLAATGYGGDKAIFGFGFNEAYYIRNDLSVTNLVSNTGVVASDTTGVGTGRSELAAAGYSSTA